MLLSARDRSQYTSNNTAEHETGVCWRCCMPDRYRCVASVILSYYKSLQCRLAV